MSKVYFASSGGAIYGDQQREAYEEAAPALPVSPYGIGKLTLEHYLRYFRVRHGLDSVTLRISNPYGPRQHPHRKQGLIPIALQRVLSGESILRFGSGSMVRDYLHVQDAAAMIAALVGKPTKHRVYNIGSGKGFSVSDILDEIRRTVDRPVRVVEVPTPATFIERVVLDVSRYTEEFGAYPLVGLREGIRSTWESMLSSEGSNFKDSRSLL